MSRATLILPGVFIAFAVMTWAVPRIGAAHITTTTTAHPAERKTSTTPTNSRPINLQLAVPSAVRFRTTRDRGLLVRVWLNHTGPYTFAIDTGAGITVLGEDTVAAAGLPVRSGQHLRLGGLSGTGAFSDREAVIDRLALGEPANFLPARSQVAIVSRLPSGLAGILDPTEFYSPLGYSIDMPEGVIEAMDPKVDGLSAKRLPEGGTVIPWIRDPVTSRPFVRLGDGRLALVDTGSGFGLAFVDTVRQEGRTGKRPEDVRDLGGGTIQSRRVGGSTVSIGSLVLRNVPTDILSGTERGAPVILGRDALYPFKITFDPLNRLIEIAPRSENGR